MRQCENNWNLKVPDGNPKILLEPHLTITEQNFLLTEHY